MSNVELYNYSHITTGIFIYVVSVLFSVIGKSIKHKNNCINYIYSEGE